MSSRDDTLFLPIFDRTILCAEQAVMGIQALVGQHDPEFEDGVVATLITHWPEASEMLGQTIHDWHICEENEDGEDTAVLEATVNQVLQAIRFAETLEDDD